MALLETYTLSKVFVHRIYTPGGRDRKGIETVKVLCSCEDYIRRAMRAAGAILKTK